MCGIAGWFSTLPLRPGSNLRLQAMTDALSHRGPDGRGSYLDENAALGHTRLAVIDLEHGGQPLWDHQRRACIVFNGEIYNYRSLRAELSRAGAVLDTLSDTEVVLQLYLESGIQGFDRLRGMYAFAIWDRANRRGVLVRDPLGIKPLFFAHTGGELCFGSEAKGIRAGLGGRGQLDEAALHLLLNFRYLPGDLSLFKGIRQVAPGAILEWGLDGKILNREPAAPSAFDDRPLLDALRESVQSHLVADVEVGAYLSGGMDSACVVALAKRPIKTFTLAVGDDPAEVENAARSAEILGVPNQQRKMDVDLTDYLRHLIWHLESPKVNALQSSLVARVAAENVKVALSGLGGDELFFGYNAYRIMWHAVRAARWVPGSFRRALGDKGARAVSGLISAPWTEAERSLRMLADLGAWPRVYGLLRNLWDSPGLRRKVYGPRMLDNTLPDAFVTLEDSWPDETDPVAATVAYEWRHKMVNDLLWNEDRVSMAVGLEVRTPFVDRVLANRVQKESRTTLMPNGQLKEGLRESLKAVLPEEIMNRRKSGFQLDIPHFFHQYLNPLAQVWLSEQQVRRAGLFNPDFVRQLQRLPDARRWRWHYFLLFMMLMAHIWLDLFEER